MYVQIGAAECMPKVCERASGTQLLGKPSACKPLSAHVCDKGFCAVSRKSLPDPASPLITYPRSRSSADESVQNLQERALCLGTFCLGALAIGVPRGILTVILTVALDVYGGAVRDNRINRLGSSAAVLQPPLHTLNHCEPHCVAPLRSHSDMFHGFHTCIPPGSHSHPVHIPGSHSHLVHIPGFHSYPVHIPGSPAYHSQAFFDPTCSPGSHPRQGWCCLITNTAVPKVQQAMPTEAGWASRIQEVVWMG